MDKVSAKFWDQAKNQRNASMGWAVAKARQSAIEDGTAKTIFFQWSDEKTVFFWNGCPMDIANQLY